MNLGALLNGIDYEIVCGTQDKDVKSLVYHSDKAAQGSVFFAVRGETCDGRGYIASALEKGAEVIVTDLVDEEIKGLVRMQGATLVQTEDTRKALSKASINYFDNPSSHLLTIGITGTKGKTTTAFMIKQIFEHAGIKTGIIGTVISGYDGCYEESTATTPQSYDVQRMLRSMVNADCKAVVMEVSSQGLMHQRVYGMEFDCTVFTNISPDHIGPGEHKNFEEYIYWKSMLFGQAKMAIINKDDSLWKSVAGHTSAKRIITFGTESTAVGDVTYRAENIVLFTSGEELGMEYVISGRKIMIPMPGIFNVSNSLAAVAAARAAGVSWDIIEEALRTVKIRGRTERVSAGHDFTVLVDYAHNGAALKSLLKSLREYEPARLIIVFGCGGGRDTNRRAEMSRAAAYFADFSIVTTDNPRQENPEDIIYDITKELNEAGASFKVVADRGQAIREALEMAVPSDIVVVAGKGHETYQITGKQKRHFDDREAILEWAAFGKG